MPRVFCTLDCPRKPQRIHSAQGISFLLTLAKLYGWNLTPARGCYKGTLENSFILDGHNLVLASPQFEVLQDLLQACGQETLVWINGRNQAVLVYNDGTRPAEHLGVLIPLPHGAPRPASWTEDDVGQVYICSAVSTPA